MDSKVCKGCGETFGRKGYSNSEFASRVYCSNACYGRSRRTASAQRETHQYTELPGRVPGAERCDHCTRIRTLSEARTKAKATEQWCQTCQQVAEKDLAGTVEVV